MRKFILLIVLVVILCLVGVPFALAQVQVQKSKDLRDFMLQPPNSVYREYRYSEETFLFYNIIAAQEASQLNAQKIKVLEELVKKLEKLVEDLERTEFKRQISLPSKNTDPNDIYGVEIVELSEVVE